MYHPLELMAPTHWGGGGGCTLRLSIEIQTKIQTTLVLTTTHSGILAAYYWRLTMMLLQFVEILMCRRKHYTVS